jgi:hypothetical protein
MDMQVLGWFLQSLRARDDFISLPPAPTDRDDGWCWDICQWQPLPTTPCPLYLNSVDVCLLLETSWEQKNSSYPGGSILALWRQGRPVGPSADRRPPYVCCFGRSGTPGLSGILQSLAWLSRPLQLWQLSCWHLHFCKAFPFGCTPHPYQGCDTEGCQAFGKLLKDQLHCLTSSSLHYAACSASKFINHRSTQEDMDRILSPGAHWMTYRCGTVSLQTHWGTIHC